MSAIVIGESVIEIIKGYDEQQHRPGGVFLNSAIALSQLNRHVRFLTDYGTDTNGDMIHEYLADFNIEEMVRPRDERSSQTITTFVARVGTGLAPFSHENIMFDIVPPPTTPMERLDLDLFAPRSALFGSISCHINPGDSKVLDWITTLRDTSTIYFDPNVRPTITPNLNKTRDRIEECIELSDVVKASEKDVVTLYGANVDYDTVAQMWLDKGPSVVAITHGYKGSVLYSKSGDIVSIPAIKTDVIDPFGGGDAYMAALVDCMARIALDTAARRENLKRITRVNLEMLGGFATSAASLVVSKQGPIMPTRDELMSRYHLFRTRPNITASI